MNILLRECEIVDAAIAYLFSLREYETVNAATVYLFSFSFLYIDLYKYLRAYSKVKFMASNLLSTEIETIGPS